MKNTTRKKPLYSGKVSMASAFGRSSHRPTTVFPDNHLRLCLPFICHGICEMAASEWRRTCAGRQEKGSWLWRHTSYLSPPTSHWTAGCSREGAEIFGMETELLINIMTDTLNDVMKTMFGTQCDHQTVIAWKWPEQAAHCDRCHSETSFFPLPTAPASTPPPIKTWINFKSSWEKTNKVCFDYVHIAVTEITWK